MGELRGFAVVDKPPGCTSHDVVARLRRTLGERRIGHGGTLDPDATGVLVVAFGPATRLLRFVADLEKTYVGELVLGSTTTTLDASGEVTATYDMASVAPDEVVAAAAAMCGELSQVPPMVSAVKVGGRRLHELAREGIEVERAPRLIRVGRFDVEATGSPDRFGFVVECSSGTYVRSLVAELGERLGGGAHLHRLRRAAIGPFLADGAHSPDDLTRGEVRDEVGLVAHLAPVSVPPEVADEVGHGKVLERRQLGVSGDGPWAVLDEAGTLLAVYEPWRDERAKPILVMPTRPGLPLSATADPLPASPPASAGLAGISN